MGEGQLPEGYHDFFTGRADVHKILGMFKQTTIILWDPMVNNHHHQALFLLNSMIFFEKHVGAWLHVDQHHWSMHHGTLVWNAVLATAHSLRFTTKHLIFERMKTVTKPPSLLWNLPVFINVFSNYVCRQDSWPVQWQTRAALPNSAQE